MVPKIVDDLELAWQRSRFKLTYRRAFYRMLILLMKNNVKLIDAMNELLSTFSSDGRRMKNVRAQVAHDCVVGLGSGKDFAEILYNWISYEEFSALEAGEKSGKLIEGLTRAMKILDYQKRIGQVVVKLTFYPSVLAVTTAILLGRVSGDLVPKIARMSKPEDWGLSAQLLKALADTVSQFGLVGVCSLILLAVAAIASLPYMSQGPRLFLDRIPPWSIYRMVKGSSFLLNIGMLTGAGMKLPEALERQKKKASPWLRTRVDAALYGVKVGNNLGKSLHESGYNFPDTDAVSFLRVISGHAGSDEVLEEFGKDWLEESVVRLENTANVLLGSLVAINGVILILTLVGANDMSNSMLNAVTR